MIGKFNRWLLNFLMSGWFFDETDKKSKKISKSKKGETYEIKNDYINKVAGFLEEGIKEMKKDIKKL